VIHLLDVRRVRSLPALRRERSDEGRERPCRTRGAHLLGPGRKQLGVALVEAHHRAAEALAVEDLAAPHEAAFVHLEENSGVHLDRPDRAETGLDSLVSDAAPQEDERIAERDERLVGERPVRSAPDAPEQAQHLG
jgi:hypothetical protein